MPSDDDVRQALAPIRQSWETGRLAHAYLLAGSPRGAAGALAGQVVALLYCAAKAAGRPCGRCPACRRVAERRHPDVTWVEPQKKSRGILKEQIEAVQDQVYRTAFEGGWKAVVFLHADRLNPEASNRLLKTLEEPPPRCLFLLVTAQREALLPTIVSRCQRVVLPADGPDRDAGARAAVLQAMTAVPGRSVASAVLRARLLAAFLRQFRETLEGAAGAEGGEDEDDDLSKEVRDARIEARVKEEVADLLRWLILWQRDVLAVRAGAPEAGGLAFPDQEQAVRAQAAALTYRQALDTIQAVEDMRRQIAQNLPVASVLERGLIRLTAEAAGP